MEVENAVLTDSNGEVAKRLEALEQVVRSHFR